MTDKNKTNTLIKKADKIVSEIVKRENDSIKNEHTFIEEKIKDSIRGNNIKFQNCNYYF